MRSFLTGSRVYGTPRSNSDTDMVVYAKSWEADILIGQLNQDRIVNGGTNDSGGPDTGSVGLRCGRLNLIVITDPAWYEAWKRGTELLTAARLVTRTQAVETFTGLFDQVKEEHERLLGDMRPEAQAVLRVVNSGVDPKDTTHLPAMSDWLEEEEYLFYAAGFRRLSRSTDSEVLT